ncbi:glycosyltransferase family 2 protein [Gordonia bronchialis]|uniref:glycosyltransferase n=1 Tax=Gordonia bronchialis TaxID=2054 RepID=UPI002272232D|nr:glycosyltransferase family A protein [Gordonia bronchialis]
MTTEDSTPLVAVVIPAFNEENYIADTLRAIRDQWFDSVLHRKVLHGFWIVVVDNNSTDRTADIVEAVAAEPSSVEIELITETEAGSGCAADAGFRHAISRGAVYVARTDADTMPAQDWLANLLVPLVNGKRLVGGRVRAKPGYGVNTLAFNAIGRLWRVGHLETWWRTRKRPDEERRSFAVVGNNMATDADIYLECGGFPRTRMSVVDDDMVFQRRVRALTGASGIALRKEAIAYTSLRRLKAFGVRDFVSWGRSEDRAGQKRDADVR